MMYNDPAERLLHQITRRHFFQQCGVGLGAIALGSLLGGAPAAAAPAHAMGVMGGKAHYPARAKRVIFMFMAGGPSQLELFDYKPALQKYNDQPIPQSYIEGKRFAFMDSFGNDGPPKLLGTVREFKQHGQSGAWVSGACRTPRKSSTTSVSSRRWPRMSRPRAREGLHEHRLGAVRAAQHGAWINYGIGSDQQSARLRGVAVRPARSARPALWGGFPRRRRVPFRSAGDPLNLNPGTSARRNSGR